MPALTIYQRKLISACSCISMRQYLELKRAMFADMTIVDICEHLGMSRTGATSYMALLNIKYKPLGRPRKPKLEYTENKLRRRMLRDGCKTVKEYCLKNREIFADKTIHQIAEFLCMTLEQAYFFYNLRIPYKKSTKPRRRKAEIKKGYYKQSVDEVAPPIIKVEPPTNWKQHGASDNFGIM